MKIALPINEKTMNTTICMSFGRTPFFLIYETENKSYEFYDNSAVASIGGAGIKASQNLVDCGVEVVLTPRCGENAAAVLNGADIKIYKTNGDVISENIDAFISGNLSLLSEIHSGFHNHGGK